MPSIEENLSWGQYPWPGQGDEWSREWGDAETQWHATILPRVRRFLPARRILEIGPGHGRWSRFLIDCADEYVGVDLNPECVSSCLERFAGTRHATFVVNNGKSLAAVANGSINFAFSFDSLVHAEIDVVEAYLHELSRKLASDGIAFIHHSNLGEYSGITLNLSRFLDRAANRLTGSNIFFERLHLTWDHWRATTVTSRKIVDISRTTGLVCIGQEIINWGGHNRKMVDCFSLLTPSGSRWERPNIALRNPYFMMEAHSAHVISDIYTSLVSAGEP